jgi:endonuclease-3
MKTKTQAIEIIKKLKEYYPDATCSLDFTSPFEMMIAVMLSAQCTDERVNKTTPYLFNQYNTPDKMAEIKLEELEEIIHPCGFYKNKAKNVFLCSVNDPDFRDGNQDTKAEGIFFKLHQICNIIYNCKQFKR